MSPSIFRRYASWLPLRRLIQAKFVGWLIYRSKGMRWISWLLVVLILLLQYPLWLGKGGWLSVIALEKQVAVQRQSNQILQTRNAAVDADLRDFKQGTEALEEHARSGLGMVKHDEVFIYVLDDKPLVNSPAASSNHE